MTLCDTINLVNVVKTTDPDGYETTTEMLTTAMCDSGNGVTRSEFYEAMKAGIKLTAVFEMWACDYGGQTLLEHSGTRYKVERAYPLADGGIQLNCSEVVR